MKIATFQIIFIILTNLSLQSQVIDTLDIQSKNMIIDTILKCFEDNYVYQEVALSLKDSIIRRNKEGEYSNITEMKKFLTRMSSDIRKITQDKHISINYIENSEYESGKRKHSLLSEQIDEKKRKNFDFRKVEWLPGNIGYIRFDTFEDPQYAGEIAASAVNFISNCEAIIIDLRYNHGGEEKMVRYLASYFFAEPTLLNIRYFTKQDSIVQSWTDSYIPGKKLTDKDIYILTSSNTASGAEAFTYILKNYNKATVIGENTSGAAHWADYYYYSTLNLEIKLPVARPINPITKTDWERTGIRPDINISENRSLDKAYIIALEKLIKTGRDKAKLRELEWYRMIALERLKNEVISKSDLQEYIGEYEKVKFIVKNNYLYWHQSENEEFVLIPISRDHFVFDDSEDYVLKFVRNKENIISGYQLLMKGREENPFNERIENTKK